MLITGTASGLGRYLYENLGGEGLSRSNLDRSYERIKRKGVDVIIHCAFNSAMSINTGSLYQYLCDNVLLTERLAAILHRKFIFISTVDVYPKTNVLHKEDEVIEIDSLDSLYAVTKLMSESIVINNCKDYLILRSSALLGKYSRKNSLIRMIRDKDCTLTLTADSIFNYVLYSDLLEFIKVAVDINLKGVYNVASSGNITLSEIENIGGGDVIYGAYRYDVGNIDNSKLISFMPVFNKSSKEVVSEFAKEFQ